MEETVTKEKYKVSEISYGREVILVNRKGKEFKFEIPYFVNTSSSFYRKLGSIKGSDEEIRLIMLKNMIVGIKTCKSKKDEPVYITNNDMSTINIMDDASVVGSIHWSAALDRIGRLDVPCNVKAWLCRLAKNGFNTFNFGYNMLIAVIAINLINNGIKPSEIPDMKKYILSNMKPVPLMVSLGYGKISPLILYNALRFANLYIGLKTESSILDIPYFNPCITDWQFMRTFNNEDRKEVYSYMDLVDMVNYKND